MGRSWHPGCPVSLDNLRYLTLTYRGFDGRSHSGELVVAAGVVGAVTQAFRRMYAAGFPIRQMRLVDDFGANDDASMAADNTSAFNCRLTTSGSGWSQHSYGQAVDVDPLENPYVSAETVLPPAGQAFVDRPEEPGVIHHGDACVDAFASVGWSWGGGWASFKDYQHFSANGR